MKRVTQGNCSRILVLKQCACFHVCGNKVEVNVSCDNFRYIPMEVLQGNVTDLCKADMFMLGITMYELVTLQDLPTGKDLPKPAN